MPDEKNLIERLINDLRGVDGLWEEKAALLEKGELSCRTGCFGCCVGLFVITLPEALALRAAVAGLPAEAREAVLARARRAVERSAAVFPGDAAAGLLDPERSDDEEEAWFESVRHVACPALELPSGRCAVYAARPVTCRTYGLAWREGDAVVHPPCELNFQDAAPGRVLETAIDAARLTAIDQELAEAALAAGLPAGAESTVAHALAGRAFPTPSGPAR